MLVSVYNSLLQPRANCCSQFSLLFVVESLVLLISTQMVSSLLPSTPLSVLHPLRFCLFLASFPSSSSLLSPSCCDHLTATRLSLLLVSFTFFNPVSPSPSNLFVVLPCVSNSRFQSSRLVAFHELFQPAASRSLHCRCSPFQGCPLSNLFSIFTFLFCSSDHSYFFSFPFLSLSFS
jgi:hypothetical protein